MSAYLNLGLEVIWIRILTEGIFKVSIFGYFDPLDDRAYYFITGN